MRLKSTKSILSITLIIFIGIAAVGIYKYRFKLYEYQLTLKQQTLPNAQPLAKFKNDEITREFQKTGEVEEIKNDNQLREIDPSGGLIEGTNKDLNEKVEEQGKVLEDIQFPEEINLDVPFTVQAPYANWDVIHEDACEEASVIMVARFLKDERITGSEDADKEILALAEWENKNFGFNKDTSAELTAKILTDYYGIKNVSVFYDEAVTIESIRNELASGGPVILPNFGQALGNPFFRAPGPPYHMIVIKGYTKDESFIVNDPGTKRGANFLYKYETIMRAVNDWDNEKNELSGRKAMIVVR